MDIHRFRTQWFTENKPNGFELHDIRLGGLMQRIKHCRHRLDAYIAGDIEAISELDEQLLDAFGNGTELEHKTRLHLHWATNAIIDIL